MWYEVVEYLRVAAVVTDILPDLVTNSSICDKDTDSGLHETSTCVTVCNIKLNNNIDRQRYYLLLVSVSSCIYTNTEIYTRHQFWNMCITIGFPSKEELL